MQKPPKPPKGNDWTPGFHEITTPVEIVGQAPDHFIPPPRSGNRLHAGPLGRGVSAYEQNRGTVTKTTRALEQEYQTRSSQLPITIEAELAATRHEGPTDPVPPLQSIVRELGVLNKLTERKAAELHNKTTTANAFYGGDPFNRHVNEFMLKATTMEKWPGPNGIAMQALNQSLRASIEARLLSQTIQSLHQQTANLQLTFSIMQATEQTRLAAEQEAQRIAAEEARVKAEAEALANDQEQARIAALAETERVAAEQARLTAERNAQEAREREEAWEKRLAENDAKFKAFREKMESLEAAKANRPFPVSGSAAAAGPVFTVAAGNLATNSATTLAIKSALRAAVSAVIAALASSAGAVIGGFAALAFPSPLEDSDLYALNVPLSDLMPDNLDGLYAIAEANGEIELPVAIGSRSVGNTTEFFVAATNGTAATGKVPVRLATFDPGLNVYRTYTPDAFSTGMTWTPIVRPNNSSTTLPSKELNIVVYNGTTATALEGRIDTSPRLDLYSFGGFIYVFPIESGIPPQYVVFNSPYDGATVTGKYSGRKFNPEQAGGPILELDWSTATITQGGIDLVKLHTARFNQSDANDIMIERLNRIFNGQLQSTDVYRRYYTHELRELERYRTLGYADNVSPPDDSPVWNNAHTATLEDYKLGNSLTLLYTETAINAMNVQDQREYEKELKEPVQ